MSDGHGERGMGKRRKCAVQWIEILSNFIISFIIFWILVSESQRDGNVYSVRHRVTDQGRMRVLALGM